MRIQLVLYSNNHPHICRYSLCLSFKQHLSSETRVRFFGGCNWRCKPLFSSEVNGSKTVAYTNIHSIFEHMSIIHKDPSNLSEQFLSLYPHKGSTYKISLASLEIWYISFPIMRRWEKWQNCLKQWGKLVLIYTSDCHYIFKDFLICGHTRDPVVPVIGFTIFLLVESMILQHC